MGPVKPVGQLYGSPTALTSQFLARDRYCKYVSQTPRVQRRIFLEQRRPTVVPQPREGDKSPTRSLLLNSHFAVYRNQTSEHMKNRNQQSFFQVSLSSISVQRQKKIEPWLTGIKQNVGATKQSKMKIHNSKISSNLDLPHSLVFNVLFSSLNVCVGDIKHRKTTENKLDLECILQTRWALFCISPQSPPRKLSILTMSTFHSSL